MNISLAKFYLIAKLQADTVLKIPDILLLRRNQIDFDKSVIKMDNQSILITDEPTLSLLKDLSLLNVEAKESYLFLN